MPDRNPDYIESINQRFDSFHQEIEKLLERFPEIKSFIFMGSDSNYDGKEPPGPIPTTISFRGRPGSLLANCIEYDPDVKTIVQEAISLKNHYGSRIIRVGK